MKQVLLGILVGLALAAPSAYALRVSRPPEFYEWNTNTFAQFNQVLLDFWNILNGRYQMNVVTSDPDGSIRGNKGVLVLYDNSGTGSICVNMDGATDWDCASLTD